MIRAFLLRVVRQAIEEFLTPQRESVRAEIEARIESATQELRREIESVS